MIADFPALCNGLLAAALNGVFQGGIITLIVALSLRAFGRTCAATRHAIWFCTLLLVASLVAAHGLLALVPHLPHAANTEEIATSPDRHSEFIPEIETVDAEADSEAAASVFVTAPRSADIERPAAQKSYSAVGSRLEIGRPGKHDVSEEIPLPTQGEATGIGHVDVASADNQAPDAIVSDESRGGHWLASRLLEPVSLNLPIWSRLPKDASVLLLAILLLVAGIKLGMLLSRLFRIHAFKRSSVPPPAELDGLFQKLLGRLRVNRQVRLRVSASHRASVLLGFFDPVILLPAGMPMEPEETEFVLRHELAHVRRRDDWANLVQYCILAAIPFHPAVWWISRQLSLEREIACDDHVLHQSGQPRAYALLLTDLAARLQTHRLLLAPGASNNKSQLQQRIHMILDKNRNTSPRLAKAPVTFITTVTVLSTVAIIGLMPRIILAQEEPANLEPTSSEALASPPGSQSVSAGSTPASDEPGAIHGTSATATPAGINQGPKAKPEYPADNLYQTRTYAVQTSPAAAVSVAPATVQAAVSPTVTPRVTAAPVSRPAPTQTRSARRVQATDSSIEKRLQRLERMVESLMSQQKTRMVEAPTARNRRNYEDAANYDTYAREDERLPQLQPIDPTDIEKIRDRTQPNALRARDEAARASADSKLVANAEPELRLRGNTQKHLEALRQQLDALNRQREKLRLQIQELDRQQEGLRQQLQVNWQLSHEAAEAPRVKESVTEGAEDLLVPR